MSRVIVVFIELLQFAIHGMELSQSTSIFTTGALVSKETVCCVDGKVKH